MKIDFNYAPMAVSALCAILSACFDQWDLATGFLILMIFFHYILLNDERGKEIADLNLQVEELQERLDDIDGIVNYVKLSVNPRYIGQDTSRPSAPEAQDDGRDAEDHAA